jgi:hypothetical protein
MLNTLFGAHQPTTASFYCLCQVLVSGRMDAFMVLAMLWAAVNAIPPVLFIVYFFTKGWLLRWSCHVGQILGLILGIGQCQRVNMFRPWRGAAS